MVDLPVLPCAAVAVEPESAKLNGGTVMVAEPIDVAKVSLPE